MNLVGLYLEAEYKKYLKEYDDNKEYKPADSDRMVYFTLQGIKYSLDMNIVVSFNNGCSCCIPLTLKEIKECCSTVPELIAYKICHKLPNMDHLNGGLKYLVHHIENIMKGNI